MAFSLDLGMSCTVVRSMSESSRSSSELFLIASWSMSELSSDKRTTATGDER